MRLGVEEFDPRKREKRKARKEGKRIDKRHQKEREEKREKMERPFIRQHREQEKEDEKRGHEALLFAWVTGKDAPRERKGKGEAIAQKKAAIEGVIAIEQKTHDPEDR